MMKTILISNLLFFFLFQSIGQIDDLKTNANLTYLKPLWSSRDAQSIEFRNGDKIHRALNLEDWYELNYYNKPAYYIFKSDKKLIYFYNWFAINDSRQITLPKHHIIPSKQDIQKLKELNYNFVFNSFSSGNTVSFSPIGSIAFDDQCIIFEDNSSATYWARDAYDREYGNTFVINSESSNRALSISESVALKQDGYPLRLVRPISTFIKDTILDYASLLPDEVYSIFSSSSKKVMQEFRAEKNYSALFNFQLSFDSKGVNKSTSNNCFIEYSKSNSIELPKDFFNQGINALRAPFYGEVFIKSDARLSFELKKQTKTNPGFFNDKIDKLSAIQNTSAIKKSMKRTSAYQFKAFYTFSESTISHPKTMVLANYNYAEIVVSERYLKKVNAKGPLYSVLAVIPGVGFHTIRKYQGSRIDSPKLYHYSIPVGALAATSLIISRVGYAKYKNSIDNINDDRVYRTANFFNKAAIVTGGAYAILGLIDFTATFSIGASNKIHQRKINKFIRNRGVKNMGVLMSSNEDKVVNSQANFQKYDSSLKNDEKVQEKKHEIRHEPVKQQNLTNAPQTKSVQQIENNSSYFTDSRDGKKYKTVVIGKQTWMAENLAYKPQYGNYWAYDNNPSNVVKYGYLYDFKTACQVCPKGWHLPSDKEWTTLTVYLGGKDIAGTKMKSTSGWKDRGDGSNSSGFSGLPGGWCSESGKFEDIGKGGYWWTSYSDAYSANYHFLYYSERFLKRNYFHKGVGLSVRCLKD